MRIVNIDHSGSLNLLQLIFYLSVFVASNVLDSSFFNVALLQKAGEDCSCISWVHYMSFFSFSLRCKSYITFCSQLVKLCHELSLYQIHVSSFFISYEPLTVRPFFPDRTYASKYIPIISSVSEHQPPTWPSYFMDINVLAFLVPAGIIVSVLFYYY
jgi:hypothetical protein